MTIMCLWSAEFTDQPESVVQAEGLEAVFECLFPGASSTWKINGTFLRSDSMPDGIRLEPAAQSLPVNKLFISAIPRYNNTVVQCAAFIQEAGGTLGHQPHVTENATLKVQGSIPSL